MIDLSLHEHRIHEVQIRKLEYAANDISIDKALDLGYEGWRQDYDSQFIAGYAIEMVKQIFDLGKINSPNIASARGRVAARYDLERMGA